MPPAFTARSRPWDRPTSIAGLLARLAVHPPRPARRAAVTLSIVALFALALVAPRGCLPRSIAPARSSTACPQLVRVGDR